MPWNYSVWDRQIYEWQPPASCNDPERVCEPPCNLKIADFTSSSQTIEPGESATFTGTVAETNGKAVNWIITLPNGKTSNGSGKSPQATWDGRDIDDNPMPEEIYTATLSAQTSDGKCSDTKSVQITVKSSCKLKLAVNKESTVINPSTGGTIGISGSVSDPSGKPVTWTITLPNGMAETGSGTTPSATWDGKDANSKIVEPGGSYSATISAQNTDGCKDTQPVPITVSLPPADSCGLYVTVGSSAHVASGALTDSRELFSTRGSALPLAMTLHYNSLDPYAGSLGLGWSHGYDIFLKENADGSVVLHEGSGSRRLYTLANGAYVGQPGDYSTLAKNADGGFTLTAKDGARQLFADGGKLSSVTDRNGNALAFAYANGNLATVTDPAGKTVTFTYGSDNRITNVTGPAGESYAFGYANGLLSSITYPDGGAWRYVYDDKGFLLSKTDPLGNTTTYAYDEKHRVASATDPEGKTRRPEQWTKIVEGIIGRIG
ncbi:MAG: hypothetical protein HYS23_04275 [Geobacter sp.]|nr:hypothetical protein [Geobacter sp.]